MLVEKPQNAAEKKDDSQNPRSEWRKRKPSESFDEGATNVLVERRDDKSDARERYRSGTMKEAIDILGLIVPCQTSGRVSSCLGQRSYLVGGAEMPAGYSRPTNTVSRTRCRRNQETTGWMPVSVVTPIPAACAPEHDGFQRMCFVLVYVPLSTTCVRNSRSCRCTSRLRQRVRDDTERWIAREMETVTFR